MPMKKFMTLLGASAFTLGILNSGAEAKTVYYEINGKRYSYSTNDRAQTAEARKRIQAAKAASAALAKAEAETANYPLFRVFPSKTQKEAEEAQKKVEQMLADDGNTAADKPLRRADRGSQHSPQTSTPIREASADSGTLPLSAAPQGKTCVPKPSAEARPAPSAMPAIAEPLTAQQHGNKVKSVFFDVESGIKTTIMIDGSIEEEPFDSGVLSQLASEQGNGNSLTAFVKQLRKASPGSTDETTGSVARPQKPELVQVGLKH